MRVVLYVRVSTDDQANKNLSIPSQIRELEDYCKQKKWQVVAVYKEEGESAFQDSHRPLFEEMIYNATRKDHPYDVILTVTTNRFFRNAEKARVYKKMLKKLNVRVIAIKQEVADDPMGDIVGGIFELIDEYESEMIAIHTRRGMLENARQGYSNGARTPYGYEAKADGDKKRLVVNEDEASIVREIFSMYLGSTGVSMGIKSIASMMNEKGLLVRGKPWKKGLVHAILTRTTYTGKHFFNRTDSRTHQKKAHDEWVEIQVPQIIDNQTYEAVQLLLQNRSFEDRKTKSDDSPTLLTGLLKCKCGAGMTLMTGKGGRYRYYRCTSRTNIANSSCDTPNIPVGDLDELVLKTLKAKVFTPQRIQRILEELFAALATGDDGTVRKDLKKFVKELSDVNDSFHQLSALFEKKALPFDILTERAGILTAKRDNLQVRIDELKYRQDMKPMNVTPEVLKDFCAAIASKLKSEDKTFAKEYLKIFVKEITLDGKQVTIVGNASTIASAIDEKKSAQTSLRRGAKLDKGRFSQEKRPFFVCTQGLF